MASSSSLVHLLLLIPALLLLLMSNKSLRCEAGNVLYDIGPMYPGEFLKYQDYVLMLQLDCNLVLYDKSKKIWSTETSATSCSLELKTTGELVLSSGSGESIWSSSGRSPKLGKYVLVLQEDRNLVVYGPLVWQTNTGLSTIYPPPTPIDMDGSSENVLIPRHVRYPGNSLKNGQWELKLETNCNLVLYEEGDKVIWSTNTEGKIEDGCYLKNDANGNVGVYNGNGEKIWETGTSNDHSLLVLQNDRNLALYGPPIWATYTQLPSTHLHTNTTTLPLFSS
ncbi:mannose-specific lectin 3-like protein [Cinnamomum micranthum f. kanehirae]|uniref:Mannose-specific lectin 3-like protein n=1 Tax=Cinnamomum micranthum f. kanehirae TaxID=337451 RepID=A0A443PLL5_9MAGN|nr:mannose-specific lectin 3-like protein [Cinnamomum micranthum f. kanehirae]